MKERKEKPVLEVLVDIDRPGIVEFESEIGHVKMIPFKGTVQSEIFSGIVEPCGVDTQVTNQNKVRHMSARYMLTGKDQDGADCRIFVENNAWFTGGEQPRPFRTVPTFITDSKRLAPYEIKEGDVLTFGNTTMTFYMVPGHTDGCIACFFDAYEGDKTVRCGYYGGFGFNTLQKDYLIEIGDPEYKTREIYLQSLAKVRDQKVELFLWNHCVNNDTLGRRQKQIDNPDGPNPFLDSELWGKYLDQKRDELKAFMADPKNS